MLSPGLLPRLVELMAPCSPLLAALSLLPNRWLRLSSQSAPYPGSLNLKSPNVSVLPASSSSFFTSREHPSRFSFWNSLPIACDSRSERPRHIPGLSNYRSSAHRVFPSTISSAARSYATEAKGQSELPVVPLGVCLLHQGIH